MLTYSREATVMRFDAFLWEVHASPRRGQTLNTENRWCLSPSVIGIAVRFLRHVSPLGAGSKSSVAQADEIIIALPGDRCKMSICEKPH